MISLQRLSLGALILIISGNILLYAWFSGRVRDSFASIVVQKAYVVSRMISDAGGHAFTARKLDILRSVVSEALKDQHLVAVIVKKSGGEIVLETSATALPEKLSTFETPILVNEKRLGTVITRFRLEGESPLTVFRNSSSFAALFGLSVAIAVLLAVNLCWQRRRRAQLENALAGADLPARLEQEAKELLAASRQPGNSVVTAGDSLRWSPGDESGLFLAMAQSLRHEALPDLVAARAANEASAAILDAFAQLLAGLKLHGSALFSGCEELYETAGLVTEGEEASVDPTVAPLAAPLRILAEAHGDRIMALGEQLQQAAVLRRSLEVELQRATLLFTRAGSAVEDAATAALQGSGILSRLQAAVEQQKGAMHNTVK